MYKTFKELDVNNDGTLEPEELKNYLLTSKILEDESKFDLIFNLFDEDSNGLITENEYDHFLYVLAHCELDSMNDALFYIADTDHSNSIELLELKDLMLQLGYCIDEEDIKLMCQEFGSKDSLDYNDFEKFLEILDEE